MKHILLIAISAVLLVGCDNEHQEFCQEAAQQLCSQCEKCGGDYKACGLLSVSSKAECVSKLQTICYSYDKEYNRSMGRTCIQGISQLSCEQLKTEGKPETCTRLF